MTKKSPKESIQCKTVCMNYVPCLLVFVCISVMWLVMLKAWVGTIPSSYL